VGLAILAAGLISVAILGHTGKGRHAAVVCAAVYFIFALLCFVVGLFHALGGPSNCLGGKGASSAGTAIQHLLIAAEVGMFAVTLYHERHVLQAVPLLYLALGLTMYAERLDRNPDGMSKTSLYMPLVRGTLHLVSGGCLLLVRSVTRRWVFGRMVAVERKAYEAAWHAVIALGGGATAALRELEAWSQRTQLDRRPQGFLQQLCWDHAPGPAAAETGQSQRQTRPAESLDVLYRQAEMLNPMLQAKVATLAQACGGLLPVVETCGADDVEDLKRYLPWSETGGGARVAWAEVKPVERALEKLLRTYDCDVSRLLDVCRQAIAFDRLEDLLACLRALAKDEELEVVRLKIRTNRGYDSSYSGGFRCMAVMIVIVHVKLSSIFNCLILCFDILVS
jgi:hypothetical protein